MVDDKRLTVEHWPLTKLLPYVANARLHSDAQVAQIAESIRQFGFNVPCLVDDTGSLIAGHGRLAAAKSLGLATVPVIRLGHLTETQARAYRLADNRIALNSEWDEDVLAAELAALAAQEFDLESLGFDADELDGLLPETEAQAALAALEDEIPAEIEGPPTAKAGDVWLLGPHRVMCGSSTDKSAVSRLLGQERPNLMVTDPPYGVEYDASWRVKAGLSGASSATGKVQNDDIFDWREAWALFPGDVAYVWHAGKFAAQVSESLRAVNFDIRSQIIWGKNQMVMSRGDYHWKHEPCWYAVRQKKTGNWQGDRTQTTLWAIDKPMKSETGHSTQKPVECMRRPILNNSAKGDAVYDPFLGSGTTIIAAQSEGRRCFGSEIHPPYVDIIVRRWQQFTGEAATLEGDGRTFNEVSQARAATLEAA